MTDRYLPFPKQARRRSTDRTLRIAAYRKHSHIARGLHVVRLLEGAGIPRQWCPEARAFMFPADRADDLIAYAEHVEGRVVTVEEAAR